MKSDTVSFVDMAAMVDGLVRQMQPTRNGPFDFASLMRVVAAEFSARKWNLSAYVEWANQNYAIRCERERKLRGMKTEINSVQEGT